MRSSTVLAALTIASVAPYGVALEYCRSDCNDGNNKYFQFYTIIPGLEYVFDDEWKLFMQATLSESCFAFCSLAVRTVSVMGFRRLPLKEFFTCWEVAHVNPTRTPSNVLHAVGQTLQGRHAQFVAHHRRWIPRTSVSTFRHGVWREKTGISPHSCFSMILTYLFSSRFTEVSFTLGGGNGTQVFL
jgi:hypothetical protein